MDKEFNVITICGSMKFKNQIIEAGEKLSIEGNIVLFPVILIDDKITFANNIPPNKNINIWIEEPMIDNRNAWKYINAMPMLKDMHKHKIDMSDEIYVVNVNNYIGEDTLEEIEYAKSKGKRISYLEIH